MHNAQCTMHNAQYTMHNAQCTMHCTLHTVTCTLQVDMVLDTLPVIKGMVGIVKTMGNMFQLLQVLCIEQCANLTSGHISRFYCQVFASVSLQSDQDSELVRLFVVLFSLRVTVQRLAEDF